MESCEEMCAWSGKSLFPVEREEDICFCNKSVSIPRYARCAVRKFEEDSGGGGGIGSNGPIEKECGAKVTANKISKSEIRNARW